MNFTDVKQRLLTKAKELAKRGPGWAQQSILLREATEELGGRRDLAVQQIILTVWHDLFQDGELSWGWDIDNPNSPFFHLPERTRQEAGRS